MEYNKSDYFDPIPAPENHFTPSRIISYVLLAIFIVTSVVGLWNYFLGPTTTPKTVAGDKTVVVEDFKGTIAFIRDYNVWVRVKGVEKQITTDAKVNMQKTTPVYQLLYSYPVISPDGKQIAFFQSRAGVYRLYVSNIDGTDKRLISGTDVFQTTYPVQWLKDSKTLYIETNPAGESHLVSLDTTTGAQKVLAAYIINSGCGGSLIDPARVLGARDNALSIYNKVFQLSPDEKYLIHSTSCSGYGVNELNIETKKDTPISTAVTQALYSADGKQIAGFSDDKKIYIFDARTAKVFKIIAVTEQPQSMFWSADGKTIYYTSDKIVSTRKVTDPLGNILNARKYATAITSVVVASEQETKMHTFDANAIRIVALAKDGNEFLLSLTENATKYYEVMEKKEIQDFTRFYPKTQLLKFTYLTGKSSIVNPKALESVYRED